MSLDKLQNPYLKIGASLNCIFLWWTRTFKVISNQKAKELGLRHWRNIYGDEIKYIKCRSIWFDNKNRKYRVSHTEGIF